MAEYVYPAVFHANDDGTFTITYPDLPGCISEGKSLANALFMAQSSLAQWIEFLNDNAEDIPKASSIKSIALDEKEFVNLICADIKDKKAVKRTVSIPQWMDEQVAAKGLSLSRVLQDALRERLN